MGEPRIYEAEDGTLVLPHRRGLFTAAATDNEGVRHWLTATREGVESRHGPLTEMRLVPAAPASSEEGDGLTEAMRDAIGEVEARVKELATWADKIAKSGRVELAARKEAEAMHLDEGVRQILAALRTREPGDANTSEVLIRAEVVDAEALKLLEKVATCVECQGDCDECRFREAEMGEDYTNVIANTIRAYLSRATEKSDG